MCEFLSVIVTKNDFFYDVMNDNHKDIIIKHKLSDNTRTPDFVRVEITPQDGDITNVDLNNWKLKIDQDYAPDWFCKEEVEILAKKELKKVFEKYYIVDTELEVLKDQNIKVLKNSRINWMYGDSRIDRMCGDSRINWMYGDSRINWMCGDSRINLMCGDSRINLMCGDSRINWMYGDSRINWMCGDSRINRMYGDAIAIDRRTNEIVTPNEKFKIRIWKNDRQREIKKKDK